MILMMMIQMMVVMNEDYGDCDDLQHGLQLGE